MPKDVIRRVLLVVALSLVTALAVASPAASGTAKLLGDRYVVVLAGTQTDNGFAFAESRAAALTAVKAAGGTVVTDLSRQIGVLVVQSPSATLSQTLDGSALVESVGSDFSWQAFPAGVERIPRQRAGADSGSARSTRSGTCSRSMPRTPMTSRRAQRPSTSASSIAASTATIRTSSSIRAARTSTVLAVGTP